MTEILVVGAGIAGLAFAAAARRLGIGVDIAERQRTVSLGAAGIGLHLNAQRALASIGLYEAVRAVAVDMNASYRFHSDGTRSRGGAPYTEVWGSPTWAVHRADLNDAMVSGVDTSRLTLGRALIDVRFAADMVEAELDDGIVRAYDLVVGADGVRSRVRKSAVGDGFIRFGGACFWRTTIKCKLIDESGQFRAGDGGGGGGGGMINLKGSRTHLFIQVGSKQPFDDPVEGRVDCLRKRFWGNNSTLDAALEALPPDEDIHFGLLEWIEPPTWGKGRVVLIGDAAHAMAPTFALGGAMGIEDAVVLADEISKTGDIDLALSRFRARRDPRVRFVQERTAITFNRNARGQLGPGEPKDEVEFHKRNYLPLLEPP